MSDPRIVGEKFVISALLPGSTIVETSMSVGSFERLHKARTFNAKRDFGTILDRQTVYLWHRNAKGSVLQLKVTRSPVAITKRERSIFLAFEKTQRGLFSSEGSRSAETTSRMASYNAFGNILISRFLRGHSAANFWTANLILSELQALSLQRYEGSACTSGVIFVSEPSVVLAQLNHNRYTLESVGDDLNFDVGFFSTPPTFRYVDGKNAFYLVDNWRKIHGIIRLKQPGTHSIYQRAVHSHLAPLFEIPAGRMFVATVGNHGHVTVQPRNYLQLRWKEMFWSVTDVGLFGEILMSAGLAEEAATSLVSCLLAISDMRFGALVLIAADKTKLPRSAGDIGSDRISSRLRDLSRGKKLEDILSTNEVLGILTSDGLTTLDQSGVILGAGEIIDLQSDGATKVSGGGRTQAAVSASRFGLAIKVSEDGPITIFKDGALQIKFSR